MSGNRFKKNHPEIDPNDPAVLLTSGIREEEKEQEVVVKTKPTPSKSLTRNISITLQGEAIEKLDRLAEEQDISRSKVINRWLMSL